MLPERLHWIIEGFEPEGDPWLLLEIASTLEAEGNLEGAAAVCDRAFGVEPGAEKIRQARTALLDRLAVCEHGLVFRYVPGGPFLMGTPEGEDDEKPLHPVWLSPFWLSETAVSMADYELLLADRPRIVDWLGIARPSPDTAHFDRHASWRFSREDEDVDEEEQRRPRPEGLVDRARPLVGMSWDSAHEFGKRLSTDQVRYGLPTEAQWEKAARGGLIGARHAWGDDPPSSANCDFDALHTLEILPSKTFPPNGYGLYAMNGCVWEWTADWYDRDYYRYYRDSATHDPVGPARGEEKALRGGSWADCAEVVTVSFRMSRSPSTEENEKNEVGGTPHLNPNLGFRLCRRVVGQRWP